MPSSRNVPAGKLAPSTVKALSATRTRPPAFQGSAADRQSPMWRTTSVAPVPRTAPGTLASVVSMRMGFVSTEESAIVIDVTCRSSSSVQPVSSYGDGSSGL